MKSNNEHDSRSEHARNESRDAEGRFKSEAQGKDTSHMGHGRGAKEEKESLNPHDKMTDKDKMDNNHKSSSAHNSRSENAKNEPRDSHGRFESEK